MWRLKEKSRLFWYLLLALVPVLVLASLYPHRLLQEPQKVEALYSVPGADVVVFYQRDCPHCHELKRYVRHQGWEVEYHELSSNEGRHLFAQLKSKVKGLDWAAPTIVVNGMISQGYQSDETTGRWLGRVLESCQSDRDKCLQFKDLLESEVKGHFVSPLLSAGTSMVESSLADEEAASRYSLKLWIIGEINLTALSLPVLTVFLGLLDGFNPCAMWALLSLLTLLLALNDIKKMVTIGVMFLLVSGIMYYIFIAAWLNVFLLLGYNFWLQKGIGLVAVLAGGFYLYESFGRDPNTCQVTDHAIRHRILTKMNKVLKASALPIMLVGVSVMAISVNMIELVCTAGLPAVFTQILANNNVSDTSRYGYLLLYILMYMLDDFIIFIIAIVTMQATGMTTKYRRLTLISGGIMMYGLGLLLIFFPDALMF